MIQRSHKLPPKTIYEWRHHLAVVQRKPGALRNGAPFLELPHAFRQLQDHMLRKAGGDREMVDILALDLSRFRSGQVLMLGGLLFESHGGFPANC